ncbi:MAG: IS1380 family transposase, partial [Blastocatellia bacterium]
MDATSTRSVVVEPGGRQVVTHVGLHALGAFADRLGLGDLLSECIPSKGQRAPVHDRGKVLVQAMLMLAGGGEACSDIEHLGVEGNLFGQVPSDSTLQRTFASVDPKTLGRLKEAFSKARAKVWARSCVTKPTPPVVLDIDASLVEIHSEGKEGSARTYKGGFGFYPMFCFADGTGEALSSMLRPGNAGSNTIADHLLVLDEAIAQLPDRLAAGHRLGDGESMVSLPIVARADSAGCTLGFVEGCRARRVGFCVAARSCDQVYRAISKIVDDKDRWAPAICQDGSLREGSEVAEVTDLVSLNKWPSNTRLIIRREPLHPGAQQSLFPSESYRYWGHYTDQAGSPVQADVFMRAHAHVEDHICRLKDSGLLRFPFANLEANRAWLAQVCFAADLVRWFQLLCLSGALATS